MKSKVAIFWFRRDLRLEDNVGLHYALSSGVPVLPIFIFDPSILSQFENTTDRRVDYIHQALTSMHLQLKQHGTGLATFYDEVSVVFDRLLDWYDIQAVYCNRDYEPEAINRDTIVYNKLKEIGIPMKAYKDQVIFDRKEILKTNQEPYVVYTPFSKKWKEKIVADDYKAYHLDFNQFFSSRYTEILSLKQIGFEKTDMVFQSPILDATIIDEYHLYRDFPAMQKTTNLGIALRFGTISIRKCVTFAIANNQVWLNELIWREFFMQILYHYPHVAKRSFRKKYDDIAWSNDEQLFAAWCEGRTGYPIVDAGMRELLATGNMHNRVRMIVASFLCKHLLIDWRWGEAFFAQHLNDYDLAANNGNWQWAAGCGCDAAPYFRVFNPMLQMEKFDKDLQYTKKWVPELGTSLYPKPIVEHAFARDRAIKAYASALN